MYLTAEVFQDLSGCPLSREEGRTGRRYIRIGNEKLNDKTYSLLIL